MVMAHTTPAQGEWTVEAWRELPEDGNRYEVIDGVLYVTPSPRGAHQEVVRRLIVRLSLFLENGGVGHPWLSPADVRLGLDTVVQPDLFVVPLVDGHPPRDWADMGRLLLVIEVLSPGTAARDRGIKRHLYQQNADEYWIVDLDGRVIERWQPGDERPEVLNAELKWLPAGAAEAFTLDLEAFFRDVCGD